MADASVSKTDVRKDVRVRLPLSAPVRKAVLSRPLPIGWQADEARSRWTVSAGAGIHGGAGIVTDVAVSVQHLAKRYGRKVAVDDVSFSIQEGEIFGIIGPNGAGKTTTVECISGLRAPVRSQSFSRWVS